MRLKFLQERKEIVAEADTTRAEAVTVVSVAETTALEAVKAVLGKSPLIATEDPLRAAVLRAEPV